MIKFTSVLLLALLVLSDANAGPQKALKQGFILNDQGQKCWYFQEFQDQVVYFTNKHTQDIGIIEFEDKNCMAESEFGLEINKTNINKIISKWYSHDDADFQTSAGELYPKSMLQIKGQCMQSKTYSIIGVLVDYTVKDGSSVGACRD